MRIAFSRFPSSFLHRDLIRNHHLVFTRHTVTQPTAHPPPQQRSMRRLRIHPSLQLKVRNQNLGRTVSNRFIPISDRNYLGDSPQNISPKITPQESPPNIYSAGIHQVCGDAELIAVFIYSSPFVVHRKMLAEQLTSTRRSSHRRHTARNPCCQCRIRLRRSQAMRTLRPRTSTTSNQNPITPRRSSCPKS